MLLHLTSLTPKQLLARFACVGFALGLASCASTPKEPEYTGPRTPPTQPTVYHWDDALASSTKGAPRIRIGLKQQKATIYKGNTEIGWTAVASGLPSHPTPTGSFKILEKTVDKRSNLYGRIYNASGSVINGDADTRKDKVPAGGKFEGSYMKYWMRLTGGGVGLHVGPQPRPGYRASHGCIRLPEYMAERIFRLVSLGTPVTIVADDGSEPLSSTRDAYEADLAAYTAWVKAEWAKHHASTPEGKRAARDKQKAEAAASRAARRGESVPPPSPAPAANSDTPAAGQTVFLDPQAS
jgi:hypothetical protein